jgi:predicted GIY-YIG superfamily endonuclease
MWRRSLWHLYSYVNRHTNLTYIGKTTRALEKRIKEHANNVLEGSEKILTTVKAGGSKALKKAEQQAIDAAGGIKNLANKIEAIAEKNRAKYGLPPNPNK